MTKLLHLADLHAGYRQYAFQRREQDFYDAIDRAFDAAIQQEAAAILLAGDNFDTPRPPAEAVNVLQKAVERARCNNVRVLGIDGNHDLTDNNWLRICGIEPLSVVPTRVGCADIMGVNATSQAHLFRILDDAVRDGRRANILVIHQALTELGGGFSELSAADIASRCAGLGVKYVALGDIHDYHDTVIGGVRFCYPGSLEMKALDENPDKCLIFLDVDPTGTVELAPVRATHRQFRILHLNEESDLDGILQDSNLPSDQQPLMVVSYKSDNRDLAARAEAIMVRAGMLFRMYPVTDDSKQAMNVAKVTFERHGAIGQLKSAIEAFFDSSSDEYELIQRLLDAPDNVTAIVNEYVENKKANNERND